MSIWDTLFGGGSGGGTGGTGGTGGGGTGGGTTTPSEGLLFGIGAPDPADAYAGAGYIDLQNGVTYVANQAGDDWVVETDFQTGGLLFGDVNPGPSDGYDGAKWFNTTTGSIFTRTAGVWSQTASLVGPTGPVGPANGREFRSFAVAPFDDAIGQDGDTGLDRATGDLYTKSGGTWLPTGQNVSGPQGPDGKSAYQVWIDQGNTGTVAEFFDSLRGPAGSPGGFSFRQGNGAPNDALGLIGDAYMDRDDRGLVYVKIDDGQGGGTWVPTADYLGSNQLIAGNGPPLGTTGLVGDLYIDTDNEARLYQKVTSTSWVDLQRNLVGQGLPGLSAYELAVQGGFVGTQAQWLATLEGEGAYDVALRNGFVGTEQEWLDSLLGGTGESAYDAHVRLVTAAGGTPFATEAEWIASLRGPKGDKGDQGDSGVQKLDTVSRNALAASLTAGDEGELVYDLDLKELMAFDGTDFAAVGGNAPDFSDADTIIEVGVTPGVADIYDAMDELAKRRGRYCIIRHPDGVFANMPKQIVLPQHNFDWVSIRGQSDSFERISGVTLVSITGSAGLYEVTISVPANTIVQGQGFRLVIGGTALDDRGNTGRYWNLRGGFIAKSVAGNQVTFDLRNQVANLDTDGISLADAEVWPSAVTFEFVGTQNTALDPVDNPAQVELLDRVRNHEIRSNLLANNAPSTADDQGAWHQMGASRYEIFSVATTFNMPGLTDENRQEHCIRVSRAGYLEYRGGVLHGAPKGALLSTDGGFGWLLNSSFANCNISDKSADGIYSQLYGKWRATSVDGGHQPQTGMRSRENGRGTAQACNIHGCDVNIAGEHFGELTFSGDLRGAAVTCSRSVSKAQIKIVRYTEMSDSPLLFDIDVGGVIMGDTLKAEESNVAFLAADGAEDAVVDGLGSLYLFSDTGLTINFDGGIYNGQLGSDFATGGGYVDPAVAANQYRKNKITFGAAGSSIAILGDPGTQLALGQHELQIVSDEKAAEMAVCRIHVYSPTEWSYMQLGAAVDAAFSKVGNALHVTVTQEAGERGEWISHMTHTNDDGATGEGDLFTNVMRREDFSAL